MGKTPVVRVSRKGIALIETIVALSLLFTVLVLSAPFIITVYRESAKVKKVETSAEVESIVREEINQMDYEEVTHTLNSGATSCKDALDKGVNIIEVQEGGKTVKYAVFYKIKEAEPGFRKEVRADICWKDKGRLYEREVVIEKVKR